MKKGDKILQESSEIYKSTEGSAKDLIYHKSWDWLMPVVNKCYYIWCYKYEETFDFHMEYLMNDVLPHHLKHCNKTEIHSCVVEFIQWYNKEENNGNRK